MKITAIHSTVVGIASDIRNAYIDFSKMTASVVAVPDPQKGEGAGIRISGSQTPRSNKLSGDAAWQSLAYEFDVTLPMEDVQLVCELRASKGDAWFDAESLKLVKLK